jgi:hypothetical protein
VKVKSVHFNPPYNDGGKARCGRSLRRVLHTGDVKDVTCDVCLALLRRS